MSPRKAPKGNANALKHGFYSRQFKRQDVSDLDALEALGLPDLASEISMLRVAISRTFAQAQIGGEDTDWTEYLSHLGLAATRVASILRSQKILEGDHATAVSQTILRALTDVAHEMNLSV